MGVYRFWMLLGYNNVIGIWGIFGVGEVVIISPRPGFGDY